MSDIGNKVLMCHVRRRRQARISSTVQRITPRNHLSIKNSNKMSFVQTAGRYEVGKKKKALMDHS